MTSPVFPSRFVQLKERIILEEDKPAVIRAWNEIIAAIKTLTEECEQLGPDIIPKVDFADLDHLSQVQIDAIKRRGSLLIRNVVPQDEALEWKRLLREYAELNPTVDGFPKDNKQFYEIYWSRSQLEARSHPSVLKVSAYLSSIFHTSDPAKAGLVSLNTPLTYADRFRIRKPGPALWNAHTPHIDGSSIERWEDDALRDGCFSAILKGKWQEYDAYNIDGRLEANTNMYRRANQSSVFRTWQGWLAMSETAPTEGTLRVFPDVLLSTAYVLLRPFFQPIHPLSSFGDSPDATELFLASSNWEFNTSDPGFPGITPIEDKFGGQRLDADTHPHLRLDKGVVSVPKVLPGDMVFWHCDVIHSVEQEHSGAGDSSVMYIPAVPLTPRNVNYAKAQREHFLAGLPPPDFPQKSVAVPERVGESAFEKKGLPTDVGRQSVDGVRAMGLGTEKFVIPSANLSDGERKVLELANTVLYGTA